MTWLDGLGSEAFGSHVLLNVAFFVIEAEFLRVHLALLDLNYPTTFKQSAFVASTGGPNLWPQAYFADMVGESHRPNQCLKSSFRDS